LPTLKTTGLRGHLSCIVWMSLIKQSMKSVRSDEVVKKGKAKSVPRRSKVCKTQIIWPEGRKRGGGEEGSEA